MSDTSSVSGLSVLAVASNSPAAESRQAFDLELVKRYEAQGMRVNQCAYQDIDRALLDSHMIVVLTGFPKTDDPELVELILAEKLPMLQSFMERGGGLLVFMDDHYSRLFEPMNRFLAAFGAKVLMEDIVDATPGVLGSLPTSPEIATLRTDNIDAAHPLGAGVGSLIFPVGWQSGIWPLALEGASWEIAVRGEPTTSTRLLRTDKPGHHASAPPLVAVRQIGAGRLVLLPAHSTFFFMHGMHPRWGRFFIEQCDNPRFLDNLLRYLGEGKRGLPLPPPLSLSKLCTTMEWFPVVPGEQQPIRWQPRKGLIGLRSTLSGGSDTVEALCHAAERAGFEWVIFTEEGDSLSSAQWGELVEACRRASHDGFRALPGVEFSAANDHGAKGLAVLPTYWPPKMPNRRFIIQMVEEGGGLQVFCDPERNTLPPHNTGGFQAMETFIHRKDGTTGDALGELLRLQATDWFLLPVSRHHIDSVAELDAAAATGGYFTYINSPSLRALKQSLPLVESREFEEAFVSSGPLLEEFWQEGPGVTRDIWEGRYYVWSDDPAEEMLLHLRLSSAHAITTVTLYEGGEVYRRFFPGSTTFETVVHKPNDRTNRSYYVIAEDAAGGRCVSMARRTRGLGFHAHGGGDRMNTYGLVRFPCERGEYTVRGEPMTSSGTMLFGLGWRQHHLNIYPPVPTMDYHPDGGEWGAPYGRLERVQLAPVIRTSEGVEILRPLEERTGFNFCNEDVSLLLDRVERYEHPRTDLPELSGFVPDKRLHLEKSSRFVVEDRETTCIKSQSAYTFCRWHPEGGPVLVRIDTCVTIKRDLVLADDGEHELLLRYLHLEADSDQLLHSLVTLDESDEPEVEPLQPDGRIRDIRPRTFAALVDQPYGSFGVYLMDDAPARVFAGHKDGATLLQIGECLEPGTALSAGTCIRRSFILASTGKPDQAEFFTRLHRHLNRDPLAHWELTKGSWGDMQSVHPLVLDARSHTVAFGRRESAGRLDVRFPDFALIRGFNPNWSVLAWLPASRTWLPLSVWGDEVYWTLPDDFTAALVAHPVLASQADIKIDVRPCESGLRVRLHNAQAETVRASLTVNPELKMLEPFARETVLQPGEIQEYTIEMRAR